MLRNRLAKLEKLAAERAANCPGCVTLPALVLVPPDDGEPQPAPDAAAKLALGGQTVRCKICGRLRARPVIKVYFPGLPEPTAVLRY